MPIKCQSNQILTERYDYIMVVGENIFLPMKARPGEVLVVHCISIYNPTQNQFTNLYKMLKRRGILYRLNHTATLNTKVVQRWATDIYMIDGDEGGIALTPSAAGDTVEVIMQCIRMRDDEYFKAT
jgi:hypothetical protein